MQVEGPPGGRQTATVRPGKGRERVQFSQNEVDGKLSVIPSDAVPLLAAKRLDKSLFDITGLIAQGYADETSKALPLIAHYPDGVSIASVPTLAATDQGAELPSVHGRAVREDKQRAGEFWKAFTGPKAASGGVERISLDRKVHATLDRSVPQIGAPEAWAAGYDGNGTTVAVLDTGYDAAHPDLAGKVVKSANFSSSPDIVDRVGHGTHVAATIAGTGAAAGGTRKGAAPGAKLIVGKVLGDDGSGTYSEILQGMEWAASSGAKVVNMSLGGGPTDGKDDLSLGLDEISARTGTLFVVAAGNDGENGSSTIGSPGSADAALTVGAVDRKNALTTFSSKGPRLGDLAVKPDLTAPGLGIVAARAAGTSLGDPVDEHYTSMSGTSMATPHVAGAAAILAQRYPQWTAQQLKDALGSTAKPTPGLTAFQQGGGRVDVAAAAARPGVFATGTLNLGPIDAGSAAVRKEVTYTNTTSAPVHLTPRLDLHRTDGTAPGAAVRLEKSTVDVPAGGSATVGIIVDSAKLAHGNYTGSLVADSVHTTVGLMKEAPKHKVTVRGLGRDGKGAFMEFTLRGDDDRFDTFCYLDQGEPVTFEVAEGTYYLRGMVGGGMAPDEEMTVVILPEVEVNKDVDLVMDARKAVPVEIRTPRPAAVDNVVNIYTHREIGERNITTGNTALPGVRHLYVTPTQPVKKGSFEFGTRWQLTAPALTASVLPWFDLRTELFYYPSSPAISGLKWLPVVPVDGNRPDYGKARGKIALVTPTADGSVNPEDAAQAAAKAGAAMVAVVTGPKEPTYGRWLPSGERLPIPTVWVPGEQGTRLADRAGHGMASLLLHGTPVSPYLYDVLQVSRGQVPQRIVYRVTDQNSATVTANYHATGKTEWLAEQRYAWRPWEKYSFGQLQRFAPTGRAREEIVSADDTLWQHQVKNGLSWETMQPLAGGMMDQLHAFRPGQRATENWYQPVVRPSIPRGVPGLQSSRTGNSLTLRIPEFTGAEAGQYAFSETTMGGYPDEVTARLYQNGKLLKEGTAAWGKYPVPGDPSTYRLDLSVTRSTPDWQFSTHTDTSWTFGSRRPTDGKTDLLPLLQLDYGVATDLAQKARAGRSVPIELTVRNQDGLAAPRNPSMKVAVSYDDGRTWTDVKRLENLGQGRFRAVADQPRGNGYVSLRVQAGDGTGNSVQQTVIRAFGLG